MAEAQARQAGDRRPVELLQDLIRFDTSNPPGNEQACVAYINDLLIDAGFATTLLAKDPERPNLLTRLPGRGGAPPLLLYGHIDVVPASSQDWTQPPFEGRIIDGVLWGRGALDMKGGVAMMLSALLRAKADGLSPAGDVILAVLSDEEGGSDNGAKYLVEAHAERFAGVRYALGEFGGFSFYIGGKRFYPLQVGEKQTCFVKATVRGPAGHGALPRRGGTMARLARVLRRLDQRRLPVHVTPIARTMIETMAASLPPPTGLILRQLLNPALSASALSLLGERKPTFEAILRNTASATMVRAGELPNVVPSEATLGLDGRLLPGYGPSDFIAELHGVLGKDVELEIVRYDAGPSEADMGLLGTLAEILRELDPAGIPVPMLLPGGTDGRFFSRLGVQSYGFLPMNLPEDFKYTEMIHAADERVPIAALDFGAEAIYRALERYGDAGV
jgi:acetylornithine deacetylase/succinyl-diaminopimelate desuccinylase-like protein